MASQPAPGCLLEAPREARGEQFALLDNKGRCREIGRPSHCIGPRKGALKSLIRMAGEKNPSKAHAPSVFVESWRKRKARKFQRFQKKEAWVNPTVLRLSA